MATSAPKIIGTRDLWRVNLNPPRFGDVGAPGYGYRGIDSRDDAVNAQKSPGQASGFRGRLNRTANCLISTSTLPGGKHAMEIVVWLLRIGIKVKQPTVTPRNQVEARSVVAKAYPFRCCVVCGLQVNACLQIAHLDHQSGNNAPTNLARLCPTHHTMCDAGFNPIQAIRLLQDHWQKTKGIPAHKPRMKDAGAKAALTPKRQAAARKAVATRHTNAKARAGPAAS